MNWQLLTEINRVAHANKMRCMLVGGAVRDMLLDKPLHDYDFAVQPDAVKLGRKVADALDGAFYVMDAQRGTARVMVQNVVLDFAQLRGDTFEQDLRARDFTINAIAFDLAQWDGNTQQAQPFLFDPLNGAQDLRDKIIRMCSPHSIADDALRALRAMRMIEAYLGTLTSETENAVRAAHIDPKHISQERVRDELFKILALPAAQSLVLSLNVYGLLPQFLPEIEPYLNELQLPDPPQEGALREHMLAALGQERTRLQVLRFVEMLRALGPKLAVRIADRFKLSANEVKFVRTVLETQPRITALVPLPNGDARDVAVYQTMRDAGEAMPDACWLARRSHLQISDELIEQYFSHYAPHVAPAPLLDGSDLLRLGIAPGPHMGRILDDVRCAQMTGKFDTREQALERARQASPSRRA